MSECNATICKNSRPLVFGGGNREMSSVSMSLTRSWHSNGFGTAKVVGPGPLSDRFRVIEQEGRAPYLVFADTMKYRSDGGDHPLDVRWNCEFEQVDTLDQDRANWSEIA